VPDELTDDAIASAEWSRIVPQLRAAGMIAVVERNVLIAACQQWAIYQRATKSINRDGAVIVRKNGTPALNKNVMVAQASLQACRQLWIELGLTPSSRTRMVKLKAADQDTATADRWAGVF
jgi:P27 family predicted phage terminase small subunit